MGNIYTIPASFAFLESLAQGIYSKYYDQQDPYSLHDLTILLPSRRACRDFKEILLNISPNQALILPKIFPIGDIEFSETMSEEELYQYYQFNYESDINPAISPLMRKALLAELVSKINHKISNSFANNLALANQLLEFIDELQRDEVNLEALDALANAVDLEQAEHWQSVYAFIKIITRKWPKILAAKKLSDPIARRNSLIKKQAEFWQKYPSNKPIIIAGSTGSNKATSQMIKIIAGQPLGNVILLSFDPAIISDEIWQHITPSHPFYHSKNLIEGLKIEPAQIKIWPGCLENYRKSSAKKLQILSDIFIPAECAAKWSELSILQDVEEFKQFSYISCKNIEEEALTIAINIRQILQNPDETVALVSNNPKLTKRVKINLSKWNIDVNDTTGLAIKDLKQMVFLKQIIEMLLNDPHPSNFLALLKSPYFCLGYEKAELKHLIWQLEHDFLHEPKVKLVDLLAGEVTLPETLKGFCQKFQEATSDFSTKLALPRIKLSELLQTHIKVAELFATNNQLSGRDILWGDRAGNQLYQTICELEAEVTEFGEIDPQEYLQILDNLMPGSSFFASDNANCKVAIFTPIEARFINYDNIIIPDLNEDTWPAKSDVSPWINNHMRTKLELTPVESKIGQAALDFFTLAASKKILLTRSQKCDASQTVPSRFLLRLEAVARKLGIFNIITANNTTQLWAGLINQPEKIEAILPPMPMPSVELRPKRLSVTQIEQLMRNPYAVYARYILQLRPLQNLAYEASNVDFGIFVHQVMESMASVRLQDHEEFYQVMLAKAKEILAQSEIKPNNLSLWWNRFIRLAKWFAEREVMSFGKVKAVYAELPASMVIGENFTLSTKIDRIEISDNNQLEIIDFKTGTIPDNKEVLLGIASQLVLEAMIIKHQSSSLFQQERALRIEKLTYLNLTGGENIAQEKNFSGNLDELMLQAEEGVKNLINQFSLSQTPYLSSPLLDRIPRYDEYQHLARRKEWF